jgi:hypothetical protein
MTPTTTTTATTPADARPLRAAYAAARDRAAALRAAADAAAAYAAHADAAYTAAAAAAAADAYAAAAYADAARLAWLESDEIRTYAVSGEGAQWEIAAAPSNVRRRVRHAIIEDAEDTGATQWWHVTVRMVDADADGDDVVVDSLRVQVDPGEPDCADDHEHHWISPHWLLGGVQENPGVVGHGGGVVCTEVCRHCGCARVTDTWATDPEDGTQGHTTVSYEAGRYADDLIERGAEAARRGDVVDLDQKGALYRIGYEAVRADADADAEADADE